MIEMKKYDVIVEVVDRIGPKKCHHHHEIGDKFNYFSSDGSLCRMAAHVIFPYAEILRYGGEVPSKEKDEIKVCCSDVDVINVFKLTRVEKK